MHPVHIDNNSTAINELADVIKRNFADAMQQGTFEHDDLKAVLSQIPTHKTLTVTLTNDEFGVVTIGMMEMTHDAKNYDIEKFHIRHNEELVYSYDRNESPAVINLINQTCGYPMLAEIIPFFYDVDLSKNQVPKPPVDVVALFSDMQANAVRILDITVQRNGRNPLARQLNIEESELWTTFGDGMYWYEEPATGAIYYAVLFVLPAKHDVPAGNPENDRLAFFFKYVDRKLTLAEIRVNGDDIANAAGSFSGWIFSNEELVTAFYERSEEMRADIEGGDPWPDAKPVRVTIESDDPHQAAMLTALLREAILLRDMRMTEGQRERISAGGRHGMEIQVPELYREIFNTEYAQKEQTTLDQGLVDVRPLLVQIRVK